MSDNTLSTTELVQRVKDLERKERELDGGLNRHEKSAFANRWEKYAVNTLTASETILSDEMREIINRQGFNKNRAESIGRLIGEDKIINKKGRNCRDDPVEQIVVSFFYNAEVVPVYFPDKVPPVSEETVINEGTKVINDSAISPADGDHVSREQVRHIYKNEKRRYDQRPNEEYTIRKIQRVRRD